MKTSTYEYFKEITKVPRPSEKEWKIRNFLIDWANVREFENRTDKVWNLFIYVPATQDKVNSESVILQSHLDMVCVKTQESSHDFEKDELDIYEEEWFLKARNTTLWADDGIWIALSLASADFESHPKMELVFTVDEEQGMSGALNLDFKFLNSKRLLNLDSEDEDKICISSAWGARISLKKILTRKNPSFNQYKVEIFWMKWWHSGVEIDKNHSNAIKLLTDILSHIETWIEIVSIKWWVADNVIPSNVLAVLWIEDIESFFREFSNGVGNHKQIFDCPDIEFSVVDFNDKMDVVYDWVEIVNLISEMETGVYSMSEKIPWLVQTSMNLWIMDLQWDMINLTYLPRSSDMIEFENLLFKIKNHFEKMDFNYSVHSRYPGWQDDPNWELVKIASEEIAKQTWKNPLVYAIHAWLECWAIVAWLWEWANAISIWPNMHDVHSIKERVEIASIMNIEKTLEGILRRL
ncbi:MAG: aminoacyl-histidine dipeptidase [uncultured bacterium (gcode 4)]|uniref:Aminoacyl-histidine dipeptidase n=1 Tax=uncultured bacterium (gcode 4) TaxID=1234023 RepID=K2G2G1_9BACT|nr:MAG: aminoacyl-histidine dipeptidase [uncultured bacterium (gcode 4)]